MQNRKCTGNLRCKRYEKYPKDNVKNVEKMLTFLTVNYRQKKYCFMLVFRVKID